MESIYSNEPERLAAILHTAADPEQILLFGTQAQATPFSDITAYDLLAVVSHRTPDDWERIHSHLNLKFPTRTRAIPFINLHVFSTGEIRTHLKPFYQFVRSECKVLYSRNPLTPIPCNYEKLHLEATTRYPVFMNHAASFLRTAAESAARGDWPLTAFHTSYAAEMLLCALHAAYYAAEPEQLPMPILYLRMRTLPAELFTLLDPERSTVSRMLGQLNKCRNYALHDPAYRADTAEIAEFCDRTHRMQALVERLCRTRTALYAERSSLK